MPFMIFAVVAGLVVGLLGGGSWRHLGRRSTRLSFLLLAGAGLQVGAEVVEGRSLTLVLASYGLLAAFAVANLHLVGMVVVLVGILMNGVVVAVNGGMPVRADALVTADVAERSELPAVDLGPWRHLEGPGDRLTVLADVIPAPGAREVLSLGDLVLGVGAADVVARLLLPSGLHRPRRGPAHAGGRRGAGRPAPEPS